MGSIVNQMEGAGARVAEATGVRCPLCGAPNTATGQCRHVRWTFERGGPLDFARHALSASPLTQRMGRSAGQMNMDWLTAHGDEVIDLVTLHFGVEDGFVFGELAQLDMISRDLWRLWDAT